LKSFFTSTCRLAKLFEHPSYVFGGTRTGTELAVML